MKCHRLPQNIEQLAEKETPEDTQTACCTECRERRPTLFTPQVLYVLTMLIRFLEGLWNQELMLHLREASY